MQKLKRTIVRAFLGAAAVALSAAAAHAAEWPERPIRLIVPYPTGGLADIVSRTIGDEVSKVLGTPVVMENRSGAGGQIGLQTMLQAPKDGYTIAMVVPATMITLPLTNPDYKIKPLEQLEPITIAVDTFVTLVVDPALGIKTLDEFVAYAKSKPEGLNYGTPGAGTSFHFAAVLMAQKLGINAVHVPYKGEQQILNDIAGRALQFALVTNTGKSFIDAGKVTALAVTSSKRVSSLPNIPTFREAGVDFTTDGWVGYAAAKGTPKPIMDKLNAAFVKALNTPAVKQRLTDMGYQVIGNTPEQFTESVRAGMKKYGDLVRSGAVKMN
ncbi:MAG: Bug family tripartite tricarboxylate transporter substrate binding protein [Burkholderiaceae bacterium]